MSFRQLARSYAPRSARDIVRRLRKAAKGPPIFETELGAYRLVPDPSATPRLTLVLPSLSRRAAFGGITTGLDVFRRIGAEMAKSGAVDLRLATTDPEGVPADSVLKETDRVEILPRRIKHADMPTRKNDIFIGYNWAAAANLAPLLARQSEHFQVAPRPLLYLIQEYEPGFFPFSADHLLIRWALEPGWPVHAIVNSSLLAEYLQMQGHSFARTYVFEPRLNPAMRPFLAEAPASERRRTILVYGRPLENRNCFPILRQGLQLWAARHPEQSDWEVLSAGADHRPLRLDGGRQVTSVGKLSLEAYARLLCESAIGISLMASPHPSYPPLEMAHFGMRVITNRFAHKDLSRYHDNILSLPDPRPETLAETLATACRSFEEEPRSAHGASRMPDYAAGDLFPLSAEIAADIGKILRP